MHTFLPTITDQEDFFAGSANITMPAGETRACINLTIVDDDVMEPVMEVFDISLDEIFGAEDLNPELGNMATATVTILDDDGKGAEGTIIRLVKYVWVSRSPFSMPPHIIRQKHFL